MKRVLTGLVLGVPLVASGQASDPDRIAALVEQLKNESFVTRELAEKDLQYDEAIALEDLEAQLMRDDLTQEQRIRLLKATSMRFASEPRGAMGIQMADVNDLGLQIAKTIEGFDAFNKIQPNDIIAKIGELPIRSTTDLQAAIISRSPGDVVPVELVRGAERMTVDIVLGAWSELSTPGGIPRSQFESGWLYRSRHYASKNEPSVIEFDADPNAWNESATRGWDGQGPRRNSGDAIRQAVVVGGEARPMPGSMAGVRLDRPLAPSARGRASDFPPMLKQELNKTELDIIDTQERIRRLEVQIDLYKQNATRITTIQQAELQLKEFESILDELNRRATRLRQELTEMGVQDP
ncbi:MAG: PDZ domain-containing protein [Phycisphaerales bacterium]|nr:PDZ domain-containing protein [Phycisphaerales bacterium]MCB9835178.1 PDZ domain-containing protein [Phycisphaera sp.]